jgi:hypothetical protein
MQAIAELTNECLFDARTGQEPFIRRHRIKGMKELEASDESTNKGIHGDHTFCFEFAERHVNRPLIRTGRAKAAEGQIGTFTDAHAGVANSAKKHCHPGLTEIRSARDDQIQSLPRLGGLHHRYAVAA